MMNDVLHDDGRMILRVYGHDRMIITRLDHLYVNQAKDDFQFFPSHAVCCLVLTPIATTIDYFSTRHF